MIKLLACSACRLRRYPGLITTHPTGTEDYTIRGKFKVRNLHHSPVRTSVFGSLACPGECCPGRAAATSPP